MWLRMKQLAFVLLLLPALSTWAEWTRVARSDEVNIYIDANTIRKRGNISRDVDADGLQDRPAVRGN
jgi:hypothetical protein